MSLRGQTVRIIVNEPYEWDYGNLFGTIIYDRGGEEIIVKLTKSIKGKKLTSDLLKLLPRYANETFKPLTQHYAVTVGGSLVNQDSNEFDYILIGSVTID